MKKVIVFSIMLFLVGCSEMNVNQEPELFLGVRELVEAYEENEVAASVDYDGKRIQLTGIFRELVGDKDNATMKLLDGVTCEFSSNIENLLQIEKYKMVTINGTVDGESIGGVELTDCEFVGFVTEPSLILDASMENTDYGELTSVNVFDFNYSIFQISGIVDSVSNVFGSDLHIDTADQYHSIEIEFSSDFNFDDINRGDEVLVEGVVYVNEGTFFTTYTFYGYSIDILNEGNE